MDIIDRIYEAAFLPDLWPHTLHELATLSESAGGVIQVVRAGYVPRWMASPGVLPAFTAYVDRGDWTATLDRSSRWRRSGMTFMRDVDVFDSMDQIEADPPRRMLIELGLGWQMGAMVQLPTGDLACFTFEREFANGAHPDHACATLDMILPHLSRAGLIAARLDLERARAQVSLLETLGLPAAVLGAGGRLHAVNSPLEGMTDLFVFATFGRLAMLQPAENQRLQEAVVRAERTSECCSLPFMGSGARPPMIIHLLPITRSAQDLFAGARTVLIVTDLATTRLVPNVKTLTGLFDLSPAEAKIAVALSSGQTLAEAAADANLTIKTARTYLERVFHKTATRQQSELVALLKSAPVVGPPA